MWSVFSFNFSPTVNCTRRQLVDGAQKTWRRLDGHYLLPKIIQGVKFVDGCEVIAKPDDPL